MVCMAGLQVFIVRFFFQGARKGEFGDVLVSGWRDLLTWGCRVCMNMGMVHWGGRGLLYMDIVCRFRKPPYWNWECRNRPDHDAVCCICSLTLLQSAPTS